jgi:subtilisin
MVLLSTASYPAVGQSDRYIILSGNASLAEQTLSSLGGKKLKDFQHLGGFAAELPPGQAKKLQDKLGNSARVLEDGFVQLPNLGEGAQAAGKPGGDGGGGTTGQVTPWGIAAVNAPAAWATTRGEDCYVCIVDSGLYSAHPDLATNVVTGTNYINGGSWQDDNGHGTHVAGTIAALDNNIGVVGVAPEAKLLVAKSFNQRGQATLSDAAEGILGCVHMRNQLDPDHEKGLVINMSWTSTILNTDEILKPAVESAYNDGAILVGAAGNYPGGVQRPAMYPEVLAVTGMTEDLQFWSGSNQSYNPTNLSHMYIAPAAGVNSTYSKGSGYKILDGTSMAAAHVSGVAALMLSANSLGIVATDLGLPLERQGLGLPDAYLTMLNQPTVNLLGQAAIPEPSSLVLFALAHLLLVAARRPNQRTASC